MGFLLHVYIESSSPYGEMIKQWSSYTHYHSIILTGYEPGLNAQPIRNAIRTHASMPSCLAILQSFEPHNMESTKFTCKHGSTEILNDRNYHSWKRSVKVFLIAEDAFGIVIGMEVPPNAGATAGLYDFHHCSGWAYLLIYVSSDETTWSLIDNLPNEEADHMWTALHLAFDTSASLSGRLMTVCRFHKTTMKQGTSVSAYISTLKDIRQPFAGSQEHISNNVLIGHLLSTLPETFATIAGIIENKPAAELTLDAITTTLIDAEASMAHRNDQVGTNLNITSTTSQALAVVTCRHGKRRGGVSYRGRKPYERPSNSGLRCFYCTREGHKEVDCQLKQDAEGLRKERWSQKASEQTARVNFGDCPDEVMVHGL